MKSKVFYGASCNEFESVSSGTAPRILNFGSGRIYYQ